MGRLEGKVALVTGAAMGMGAEIARRFADEGASVVVADRQDDQAAVVAKECGERARAVHLDVADASQWADAIAAAESSFGPVSVLVNNAGIIEWGGVVDMDQATFQRVMDVNALSVFLGMKAVVPSMRRAGRGSIVNMSSTAGMIGAAKSISYTASKWAVRGMTKAAAIELGALRIRVNSVHPHVVRTPMAEASNATGVGLPPVGRFGEPSDAASLVLFLASDESGYITGSEHMLDGGALAGWR
jgi:3alpha(or 20beta)-hydroxysteroid dehydrogenase